MLFRHFHLTQVQHFMQSGIQLSLWFGYLLGSIQRAERQLLNRIGRQVAWGSGKAVAKGINVWGQLQWLVSLLIQHQTWMIWARVPSLLKHFPIRVRGKHVPCLHGYSTEGARHPICRLGFLFRGSFVELPGLEHPFWRFLPGYNRRVHRVRLQLTNLRWTSYGHSFFGPSAFTCSEWPGIIVICGGKWNQKMTWTSASKACSMGWRDVSTFFFSIYKR